MIAIPNNHTVVAVELTFGGQNLYVLGAWLIGCKADFQERKTRTGESAFPDVVVFLVVDRHHSPDGKAKLNHHYLQPVRSSVFASRPSRALMTEENIQGRPGWVLIENDGAIFRGPGRSLPTEVWSPSVRAWKPYETQPKPIEWGTVITEDQARALMQEIAGA